MTYPWNAGEVLAAADLNAEFASKLDLAGGKILQIVRAVDSTDRTTTSTTFADTGLSVTITPQKSDSAILLIVTSWMDLTGTGTDRGGSIQITDNSNNAIAGGSFITSGARTGSINTTHYKIGIGYSTPATTSATTYKLRFRVEVATATLLLRNATAVGGQLFAIEVSA